MRFFANMASPTVEKGSFKRKRGLFDVYDRMKMYGCFGKGIMAAETAKKAEAHDVLIARDVGPNSREPSRQAPSELLVMKKTEAKCIKRTFQ